MKTEFFNYLDNRKNIHISGSVDNLHVTSYTNRFRCELIFDIDEEITPEILLKTIDFNIREYAEYFFESRVDPNVTIDDVCADLNDWKDEMTCIINAFVPKENERLENADIENFIKRLNLIIEDVNHLNETFIDNPNPLINDMIESYFNRVHKQTNKCIAELQNLLSLLRG